MKAKKPLQSRRGQLDHAGFVYLPERLPRPKDNCGGNPMTGRWNCPYARGNEDATITGIK